MDARGPQSLLLRAEVWDSVPTAPHGSHRRTGGRSTFPIPNGKDLDAGHERGRGRESCQTTASSQAHALSVVRGPRAFEGIPERALRVESTESCHGLRTPPGTPGGRLILALREELFCVVSSASALRGANTTVNRFVAGRSNRPYRGRTNER